MGLALREFAADFGDRCVFSDLGGDALDVEADFGFRLGSSRCLVPGERPEWDRPAEYGAKPARSTADKSVQKMKRQNNEERKETERGEQENPKKKGNGVGCCHRFSQTHMLLCRKENI